MKLFIISIALILTIAKVEAQAIYAIDEIKVSESASWVDTSEAYT